MATTLRTDDTTTRHAEVFSLELDSGGTFTDAVVGTDRGPVGVKVLSTPHDLTVCFREAIAKAAHAVGATREELLAEVDVVRFSTTVGTNAVIERKGPRLGLIVQAGDEDYVGSLSRDGLPGALIDSVAPVEAEATAEEVLVAVERLLEASVDRIVVVLPDGPGRVARASERRIRGFIAAHYPRHVLGAVPVLLSTDIAVDSVLERRLATALLSSYLHPALEHFLYETEEILHADGCPRPLLVFGNDGTSNRVAKVTALRTYNSGPSGGVEAVTALARLYGLQHVVGIDIGGTSTDLTFVADGLAEADPHGTIGGAEISIVMRRVNALGGGGGTIARLHDGDVVVGPKSAGAAPGPACFGFGGTLPTVTDAAVVLGLIDPDRVLGGEIPIDLGRARQAVQEHLAEPLGTSVESAAADVLRTLYGSIASAIVAGAQARGWDVEDVTLVAFGGAGPGHAAGIAALAEIDRVLIPADASVLSAVGIGFSDVEHRYEATVDGGGSDGVRADLARRAALDMRGEGFEDERIELEWEETRAAAGSPADTVRLTARGALRHVDFVESDGSPRPAEPCSEREIMWDDEGPRSTPVFDRDRLISDRAHVAGPAMVEGTMLTLGVPPGWSVGVDRYGQLLMTTDTEVTR